MEVVFLKTALNELRDIHDFISRDNPTRADSFFDELMDKAIDVGRYPYIFPVFLEFPQFRKRSHRGYIILYRVKNNVVEIMHILNSVRDYGLLLKKRKAP